MNLINLRHFGPLVAIALILVTAFSNCSGVSSDIADDSNSPSSKSSPYKLSLAMTRIDSAGFDPFKVTVTLTNKSKPMPNQTLVLNVPLGTVTPITDHHDGTYSFIVTPPSSGVYPVEVRFKDQSVQRDAVVLNSLASGVGQPMAVPGKFVNTAGWEDGITITPDGNYLFVHYGPLYMMGAAAIASICSSSSYSAYDLLNCPGNPDSDWVFNTIGPYANSLRPRFPTGAISNGHLTHSHIVIPGVVNGLAIFPTVFYGFKRQPDGTFAEPFKVAFNDARGTNGPFGLSFQMTGPKTAKFIVAWSNYFNDLGGDQMPDVYSGTMTMGQDKNLGNVTYSGETFASITPNITAVSFASHAGVQGNPHLHYNSAGVVKSIWTDDEQVSHDISVYRVTAGSFPGGTWQKVSLPSKINTGAAESQPFFTGTRLYLNRDTKIVYHEYLGSGGADFNLNASWGNEVVVLEAGNSAIGSIYGVGEPTLAEVDGKLYLYFVYIRIRDAGSAGRIDVNLDAGFVELP